MPSICHLTSAHSRFDSRIFYKECISTSKNYFETTLIVADGKGNDKINNIRIIDVGILKGRIKRMLLVTRLIYKQALSVNADIYHFHDPELLYVGYKLKKKNKKVIFDSHEDVVNDLLYKPYLKPPFNKFVSKFYKIFEHYIVSRLDGVIGATPVIKDLYLSYHKNVINLNNYPILDDYSINVNWENKRKEICYVGSISTNRGCFEIISALDYVMPEVKLNLVGKYSYDEIQIRIKTLRSFSKVNEYGFISKDEVLKIYDRSLVGLITLLPIPTFKDSLPIKMFEYMAAGIPFVASDFPQWIDLIGHCKCCIFVNPEDPVEIASAINYLISNFDEAKLMGENGRRLVEEKFNWKQESEKLIHFYNKILTN